MDREEMKRNIPVCLCLWRMQNLLMVISLEQNATVISLQISFIWPLLVLNAQRENARRSSPNSKFLFTIFLSLRLFVLLLFLLLLLPVSHSKSTKIYFVPQKWNSVQVFNSHSDELLSYYFLPTFFKANCAFRRATNTLSFQLKAHWAFTSAVQNKSDAISFFLF